MTTNEGTVIEHPETWLRRMENAADDLDVCIKALDKILSDPDFSRLIKTRTRWLRSRISAVKEEILRLLSLADSILSGTREAQAVKLDRLQREIFPQWGILRDRYDEVKRDFSAFIEETLDPSDPA